MDIASSFKLPEEEEIEQESGTASQTDVDQPLFEAMHCELQTLRTEHMHLKEQVSCISEKYKVSDFKGNDDKTKYYTGLPTFALLWTLLVRPIRGLTTIYNIRIGAGHGGACDLM